MASICDSCLSDKNTCSKRRSEKHLSVTINVTDRCNDICKFCWHKDSINKDRDMNKEDIDNMLDSLIKQFPTRDISLFFIGGEPTLNIEVIDYALGELKKRNGKYYGTIVTNGVSLSDGFLSLLSKYPNLKTTVSLPNKYMKLYAERLKEIKKYIALQDKFRIDFSLVITEERIRKGIHDEMIYWRAQGVKDLFLIHEFNVFNTIGDISDYEDILIKDLTKIKDLNGSDFRLKNFAPLSEKQYINENIIKLSYFSDGNFYINNKSKFFGNSPIGNTADGVDLGVYENILKSVKCYTCKYNNVCTPDIGVFMKDNKYIENEGFCLPARALLKIRKNI